MGAHGPATNAPITLTTPDGGRIVVHAFPNEAQFLRDIRVAVAVLSVGEAPDAGSTLRAQRTQAGLRAWYPSLEIRPRDDRDNFDAGDGAWYVFRDGRLSRPGSNIDRMHRALSDARDTAASSDQAVERARAMVELASHPRHRDRTATAVADR